MEIDKQNKRPPIEVVSTGAELLRWYWHNNELLAFARSHGLRPNSGKFVILDRIAHFIDTGEKEFPGDNKHHTKSKFDWHKAELTKSTNITDNYKNTQNVRRFFKNEIGEDFKFNIAFMEWIKGNIGKNLDDACGAYLNIRTEKQAPGFRTKIKDHNQFNQYTRDFLDGNPNLGMTDVRRIWALKIQLPSATGRHVYDPDDLKLDI